MRKYVRMCIYYYNNNNYYYLLVTFLLSIFLSYLSHIYECVFLINDLMT